jgi:HEAT repeat protein
MPAPLRSTKPTPDGHGAQFGGPAGSENVIFSLMPRHCIRLGSSKPDRCVESFGEVPAVADLASLAEMTMTTMRIAACFFLLIGAGSAAAGDPKAPIKDLQKGLQSKDSFERQAAAGALAKLGPKAKDAVPALIKALEDPDEEVRQRIPYALGKIGPAAKSAVPALIARLKDESEEVRYWAALALGQIDPEAAGVFDALKGMVKEPKAGPAAATTLGLIKSKTKEVLVVLGEALPDPNLQRYVTTILGKMGPAALPTLTPLLKSDDSETRTRAAAALGLVGKDAVPVLADALKDATARVRLTAAASLAQIGPGAKSAVKNLTAALKDERPEVRAQAAEALGNIGLEARAALPALDDAESDPDADVRIAVRAAMKKIEK